MELHRPGKRGVFWLACQLYDQVELDRFWAARLLNSREGTQFAANPPSRTQVVRISRRLFSSVASLPLWRDRDGNVRRAAQEAEAAMELACAISRLAVSLLGLNSWTSWPWLRGRYLP
jgi:hypothetical protein